MLIESFIALNRFGFGATPGNDPTQGNARGWLEGQIDGGHPASIPTYNLPGEAELIRQSFALIEQLKDEKRTEQGKEDHKEVRKELLNALGARFVANLAGAPLLERLVLFWSNHFTVSIKSKPILGALALSMERDAIRPHVLGRFEDMLLATAKHPAMLLYLDNALSIGPDSRAGRRGKGLNENYAREVMELHTLGARGGYTQADVTNLAKILTGWTLNRPRRGGNGEFTFVDFLHEPGPQTIMGRMYNQSGIEQGEAVLRDLAYHPSTARFIATKLVRHFVADDPPPADIERVALAFSNSGGDLAAVTAEVMRLDSVWRNPLPKVKTPYEMMLSAIRATGLPPEDVPFDKLFAALTLLDNVPFTAPSPAGWSDKGEDWISAEALLNRVELCHMIARKAAPRGNPAEIAEELIGPVASNETLTAIRHAPSPADGFALTLASPEFQRR